MADRFFNCVSARVGCLWVARIRPLTELARIIFVRSASISATWSSCSLPIGMHSKGSSFRLEPPPALSAIAGFESGQPASSQRFPDTITTEAPLMQSKHRAPEPNSPDIPLLQRRKRPSPEAPAAGAAPLSTSPEHAAIFDAPSPKLFDHKSLHSRPADSLRHDMQGEATPRYTASAVAVAAARRATVDERPAGKPAGEPFIPHKRAGALRHPGNLSGSGLSFG